MCNERTRQMYIKKSRLVTIGIRSKSVVREVSKKLSDNASDIFPRLLQRYLSILSKPEKTKHTFLWQILENKMKKGINALQLSHQAFSMTNYSNSIKFILWSYLSHDLSPGKRTAWKSIPPFCKQLPNLTKLILAITNCMKRFLTILTHFIELLEYPGNQPTFFNLCDSKGFC